MTNDEIKLALRRVLNGELDDCERALRNGDPERAKRELDDAISKLTRLMRSLG